MVPLSSALTLARELGPRTLSAWLTYQIQRRSGWLRRRTPVRPWETYALPRVLAPGFGPQAATCLDWRREHQPPFFFPAGVWSAERRHRLAERWQELAVRQGEAVLAGRFPLFGDQWTELGLPPDFNRFPPGVAGAGQEVAADRHWSRYHLASLPGDVKYLWEPSRWAWVFLLVRAYRLSGEARFAAGCLELLRAWRVQNPPNAGVQWFSAQEAAIRLLALSFAAYGFWPWLAQHPHEWALLLETVAAHARRIPPTLAYARAQRNNHLLLEAVGLYSAGLLFPELRGAGHWRALGRRWLERALLDQIMADGGYIQHSTNYHRLMLQTALWAARLAALHQEPLPAAVQERLRRAAIWLAAFVDPSTGQAPNWGHNDGALLLPFGARFFADQRPTVQAAWRAWLGGPRYPAGEWDELGFWLGLQMEPMEAAGAQPVPTDFPASGLYRFGAGELRGALRCAHFTTRPAHADQLQLDLWWRGINVALDPGTYLYQAPAPWQNGLAGAVVHNGPLVDGREPMRRLGPFLWADWAQGELLGRWADRSGALEMLAAEHYGYRALGVTVRRTVVRAGERLVLVVDDVLGQGEHRVRVGWSLPALEFEARKDRLLLRAEAGAFALRVSPGGGALSLYRQGEHLSGPTLAGETRRLGWQAPNYGCRAAALYAARELQGALPLRLVTWWDFDPGAPVELEVQWNPSQAGGLPIAGLRLGEYRMQV